MRTVRLLGLLSLVSLLTGCGFVHFGRLPEPSYGGSDAAAAQAFSSLSTSHKMLQQELALARKEGETLRVALERAQGQAAPGDAGQRMAELSSELASLRASYAKLQVERAAGGAAPAAPGQLAQIEEKLAASLRNYTQLQEENARLRRELDRTRSENSGLASQLKSLSERHEQAQASLAQLNTELLLQREARTKAEQSSAAMRAQLATVMAQSSRGSGTAPSPASGGGTTSSLELAKAAPADASPTVELRTNADRIRPATDTAATGSPAGRRVHVVREGDTLDKLAREYFGDSERWRAIYDANVSRLGQGQPLQIGMELEIPAR
jgi:nucleoid-associated protein YgaU